MGKMFTSIVELRLRIWLDTNFINHMSQAAFRNN